MTTHLNLQFYLAGEQLSIRSTQDMPAKGKLIESPYDVEARNRTKRTTHWRGYCVSLTETCDEETPNLIINVETVAATKMDVDLTESIHDKLAQKGLLPKEHFMDTGYVSAEDLVNMEKRYDVEIVGPVLPDVSWQAQANKGFDLTHFTIDWQNRQVRCPEGNWTQSWSEQPNRHQQTIIHVHFSRKYCDSCPVRSDCTQAQSEHGRSLNLLPEAQHVMLQKRRQYQKSEEFQERYATRAGVEGCLSQGVRAFGLRRSRYIGLAKTHLQHVVTAVAMNLARLWNWWQEIPKSQTRVSRFRALAPVP
jgi:transposase